jgi:hypothetical protein
MLSSSQELNTGTTCALLLKPVVVPIVGYVSEQPPNAQRNAHHHRPSSSNNKI